MGFEHAGRAGAVFCLSATMLMMAGWGVAQTYPVKPVRILTAQAGGASELATRLVANGLTAALGQSVLVDNRPGAAGAIAAQAVAKSSPDGYTLLAYSTNVWLLKFLRKNVPFEISDFAPVIMFASSPNVLVVHPSLPVKSVRDLIGFAKGRPGQLSYSSGGSGSTLHLAAELFKSMAGINILHVPYKSGNVGMLDLLGGRVEVMFPVAAAAIPHQKTGRLRLLAVTSPEPSPLVPGVPTVAEAGLPGYAAELTVGIYGPAAMPPVIAERLNQEVNRLLEQPDARASFLKLGLRPVGGSTDQMMSTIKSETVKWGKLIGDIGIRAE